MQEGKEGKCDQLNEHIRLVIGVRGEDFGFLGRNSGVTLDESSHNTTSSLDTEGERSYIEQEEILHFLRSVTSPYTSLNSNTITPDGNFFGYRI